MKKKGGKENGSKFSPLVTSSLFLWHLFPLFLFLQHLFSFFLFNLWERESERIGEKEWEREKEREHLFHKRTLYCHQWQCLYHSNVIPVRERKFWRREREKFSPSISLHSLLFDSFCLSFFFSNTFFISLSFTFLFSLSHSLSLFLSLTHSLSLFLSFSDDLLDVHLHPCLQERARRFLEGEKEKWEGKEREKRKMRRRC